ncbi:hypothetical protein Q9L42_002855 [Methylomarinum sp. Ch1-1]|uniref:Transposase n=1 Tax=Methylomarinum roseum TaxID=3067653 RepID=A0AAU7NVQ9_9GAMM|nr:hypothetical protein [Methylomarinum sp. Ch1-1]MDP4522890.1 hypothetical protein [Methylomarinum sp. Ch1-1]
MKTEEMDFLDVFGQLDDPRIDRKKLHPMPKILLLTLYRNREDSPPGNPPGYAQRLISPPVRFFGGLLREAALHWHRSRRVTTVGWIRRQAIRLDTHNANFAPGAGLAACFAKPPYIGIAAVG